MFKLLSAKRWAVKDTRNNFFFQGEGLTTQGVSKIEKYREKKYWKQLFLVDLPRSSLVEEMRGESSALGIFLLWLHNSFASDSVDEVDEDEVEVSFLVAAAVVATAATAAAATAWSDSKFSFSSSAVIFVT